MQVESWAVVTGAAGGIGREVVDRLARDGYRVLAIDLDVAPLAGLDSGRVECVSLDVRDIVGMERAISRAAERAEVRALVCCAAIFPAQSALTIDEATWDRVFTVNLDGTFLACRAAIPHLKRAGGGGIVLFSSSIARTGGLGAAHYAATKGGVLGLARSLALDLAQHNIRVNVVSPGLTDTAQPRGNMIETELLERAARIPLGRMGGAREMADAAAFLLSEASSYMTGQDLRLNGGAGLF